MARKPASSRWVVPLLSHEDSLTANKPTSKPAASVAKNEEEEDDDQGVTLRAQKRPGGSSLGLADIFSNPDQADQLYKNWKAQSNGMASPLPTASAESLDGFGSQQQQQQQLYQTTEDDAQFQAGAGNSDSQHAWTSSTEMVDDGSRGNTNNSGTPVLQYNRQQIFIVPLRFRFLTDRPSGEAGGLTNAPTRDSRTDRHIAERSDQYIRSVYPDRVLMANQIRRYNYTAGQLDRRGKPLSPTTYEFVLFPDFRSFVAELWKLTEQDWTYYAVAEEGQAVFVYFDLEIPLKYRDVRLHGSNMFALFGYAIAVVRCLLEEVLGVPHLSAWSDDYKLYDSTIPKIKWSAHAHVAWPMRSIAALRAAMTEVTKRLLEMDKLGLHAIQPLFYDGESKLKPGEKVRKCVVDLCVYTKKRNLRLPQNVKRDKRPALQPVVDPCWSRSRAFGGPLAGSFEIDLSVGALLCRNSRALWSTRNIKDAAVHPMLCSLAESDAVWSQLHTVRVPEETDEFFRTLPLSGKVHELEHWLKDLFRQQRWPDATASEAAGDQEEEDELQIRANHERLDAAMKRALSILFDLNWEHLIRHEPQQRLEKFRTVCSATPHALGSAVLFICEFLRPGIATLESRYCSYHTTSVVGHDRNLLDYVSLMVERSETYLAARQSAELFSHVYTLVLSAQTHHNNGTGTLQQQSAMLYFARQTCVDFSHHILNKLLRPTSDGTNYNNGVLSNVLFFLRLAKKLLLVSGMYVHEFRLDSATIAGYGSESRITDCKDGYPTFLATAPEYNELSVRLKAYRYALESCFDGENHPAVPLNELYLTDKPPGLPEELEDFPDALVFGALTETTNNSSALARMIA